MSGVVTILFTDLVGSTELLSRLGEEPADAVRREHFGLLRFAIAAHGGVEVKSIGDSLMVAFTSPAQAVSCAVEIQQRVHARNRSSDTELGVRIGINAGETTYEDGDYFGTPVVIAKRLCDRADGGQILASELVRALVGTRGGFAFKEAGALPLKGIDDPVPACAVTWEPLEPAVPLPDAIAADTTRLVGRDGDRAALRAALGRTHVGERLLILIAGEPGIGKTTLAFDLAREAHSEGATVLYGRCEEDIPAPYQPFAEALQHLARHRPDELRAAAGSELARVIPGFGNAGVPVHSDPESERFVLFEAVRAALDAAAAAGPVLLVLDDLHWADKPTLLMLRHIVRAREGGRLLICGTYRDVELDRRHPLAEVLADLRRDPSTERLLVRGLSDDEVLAYLEARAGHTLGPDGERLARALHRETEGNPFFVREIVRHLVETGAVFERDGRWVSDRTVEDVGLPESVREVIGRRLSRLGDACGDVLAVASVLGRDFDLNVLSRITELAEDRLADLLDEAIGARGVIDEVPGALDRYTFAHALVRETLYEELSTSRRVRLHRRAGEAIEAIGGDNIDARLPELAHHFQEAALGGTAAKAIDYSRRAGAAAIAQLAFEEAVAHYERALAVLEDGEADPVLLCDLLIETGEARRLSLDIGGARAICERAAGVALDHAWGERLARAALTFGGLWVDVGLVNETLLGLLDDAIRLLPPDHPMLPLLHARLAMENFTGDQGLLETHSTLAVDAARRLGDPRTLAFALIARRHAHSGPDHLAERLAITEEAIALADRIGDRDLSLRARALRLIEQLERGAMEEVTADYDELFRRAGESRQPLFLYVSELFRIGIRLRQGELENVDEHVAIVSAFARRQNRVTAILATASQRMQLHWLRGTIAQIGSDDVEELLVGWAAVSGLETLRIWVRAAFGHHEEARAEWARIRPEDLRSVPRTWVFLPMLEYATDLAVLYDSRAHAEVIHGALEPFGDLCVAAGATAIVMTLSPVAAVLGRLALVLGRPDEAIERFEAAIAMDTRMRARPNLVRDRAELGRALVARGAPGDTGRARALLDEALTDADTMGLGAPFVVDARSLRASLGG